uniref:Uncharacterized protein n=1 Tax=Tanacetum cinerariifolium TaxID=118510 RepID=A0A6L2LCD5_TANCI|nr:hypothetical protein [Tanacetum cinerariifolium]
MWWWWVAGQRQQKRRKERNFVKDDELTENELKQIEADDQAIQTILLSLLEDIYAAVDSCETAQEIWLRVQQMMKRSDIRIKKKKAKLFNEWESEINTFQKRLPKEVDELKAKRLAKTQDPLALMASSKNPYTFPVPHQDQPSFNQNYMQQPMPNPKDITDPTTAMNMALALMAKEFKLNYSTPTNNNKRISSNPRNRQIAQPGMNIGQDRQMQMVGGNGEIQFRQYAGVQNIGNQNGLIGDPRNANHNLNGNGNLVAARAEADLDEIEEVNANYILMANLQQASTLGTQPNKAPVYDSDGSSEVHKYEDCYNNDIFNMFTQEEQYIELLEPIPESHQEPHNDNNVIYEVTSVEQSGGTVEQHPANVKETRVLYDSLYNNLSIEVEKVNTVNRNLKETNTELTNEHARFNNQEKYDKLERCYQQPVYQEQCLSKKINALHLSSGKQIMTLNGEILDLNKQLSKENSTGSFLLEEKKRLKSDFKTRKDELLDKQIQLEKKIKELDNILRLLKAVVSQNIISVVQNNSVVDTLNLKTELERMKERFENCIIKKENEYAKLWNDWYKKCEECKFDKISYDKAYNDMQQKIERLQAQLGDLKGKSKDTSCVSDTLNPLSRKLKNENVELEFQVLNYAKENAHLKTTYKNLFDSISVSRTQTKTIIASLQNKLHNTIYENAKLRVQLFNKVSDQKDNTRGTSANTKFAKQSIMENLPKVGETNALSKPVTSNSISTPQESKVVKNAKVIAPVMFRINPFKPSKKEKHVPRNVSASVRTKSITVSQPPVITKKVVNSDSNGLSSIGVDNSKPEGHSLGAIKRMIGSPLRLRVVEARIKKLNGKKQMANVSIKEKQKKKNPKVKKPKKVGSIEILATHKPSKPRSFLRWSPTGRLFDLKGKIITSSKSESQSDCSTGDNACTSNSLEPTIKRFPNSTFSLAGFSDLQWGNILITRVYLVEGLGHNLFSVGQFCDSDLEVAFRRNACFIINLERVDLLKRDCSTNLYTINLHDMASASPICLMAHASSTKSWLWHQRLSYLNFDTINDLAKNDLVSGLPKFKYHKEHLCPSLSSFHTPQQNGVVDRRNRTLVEAARTMLIFSRAPLFLWAETIATTCFNQNRSIIYHRFNKTPNELINGRKPHISFLHVFGPLCYPKNNRKDIGKLGVKGDIGFFIGYSADSCAYRVYNQRTKKIMETMNVSFNELSAMAFEQRSSKPRLQSMTSGQISSRLDLTYASSTITAQQPSEGELDLLFEAMMLTSLIHNNNMFNNKEIKLQYKSKLLQTMFQMDHPLEQVIGEPSRPVLTRNQLRFDGDICMYALTVSSMEPKNVKDAMTDPAWIESMQEELLQFKRLDVWVLVRVPDNISPLTLKWLFKNKHDEEKMVIRNKNPKKYGMESCGPVGTPMEIKDKLDLDQNGTLVDKMKYHSMIGTLMYLTSNRPDIVHATCLCARYQTKPTEKHLKEVKRIFRYLRGTINTGLWYTKDSGFELTGFLDADYAGCKDIFKSTFSGAQFLGEKLVSWSSKKQDSIAISCNPVQHSRTKHIVVCYHFIKEYVEKVTIELYFVKTDYQLADLFTKALPVDRFNYVVHRLGMRILSPQELDRLAKSQ